MPVFKLLLIGTLTLSHFISMMSVEQKVGELFLFGFDGAHYNQEIQTLIDHNIRGFIIYGRNVKNSRQVKELINSMKLHAKGIPPIIAVDQEGGSVARIRDVFVTPNAMALGSVNDENLTYEAAFLMGKDLKKLGINMDFAPVLDVNTDPMNPVIGVRSFWDTPDRVADNGVAFFKGLEDAGVIAVGKHFPGHGDTDTDSHFELPIARESKEDFFKVHVYPFKVAIDEGIPAIMTAHIVVPFMDKAPATMSKRILGYLRNTLRFDGVIISDDMLMKAISSNMDVKEAVKKSLLAGVDMFIIWKGLKTQLDVYNYIVSQVKSGSIPMKVIDRAVEKVLKLKLKLYRMRSKELDANPDEVSREISDRAISLCKGDFHLEKGKKYLIFFPRNPTASVVQEKLYISSNLKKFLDGKGIDYKIVRYNIKSSPYRYIRYIDSASKYDGVIVFTIDGLRNINSVRLADLVVRKNPNNLVVAIQSPYDYLFMRKKNFVNAYAVTYDWNNLFAESLIDKLSGESRFYGDCILKKGGGLK